GLAIADRIAQLLQHPIRMESKIAAGSMFAVAVPRTSARTDTASLLMPAAIPEPKATVLLVDNDPEVLKAMLELLEQWGCAVLPARTIAQAVQLCRTQKPDILLLDYHLDRHDTGLMVRGLLTPVLGDLPCIILTADRSEEVRNEILNSGCQVLHKPIRPLALKSAMASMLPKRHAV
ncbi:MAG: response regulator, partial [Arenimonas sp.]|nr:response regulator [Arenimonas sp.]